MRTTLATNNHSQQIVQKLWSYCNLLRDDGLSYGDYVEQLTYLLFLKMAYERTQPPWDQPSVVPTAYDWRSLMTKEGDALETHYRHMLQELGKEQGMLGSIFRKAQNKIQDPAKLRRLIADLINREQWMILDADVKGDAYEGLLEKNAQDTKTGAGQYFTPRALIQAIVEVMHPKPGRRYVILRVGQVAFSSLRMTILRRITPISTVKRNDFCGSTPCMGSKSLMG